MAERHACERVGVMSYQPALDGRTLVRLPLCSDHLQYRGWIHACEEAVAAIGPRLKVVATHGWLNTRHRQGQSKVKVRRAGGWSRGLCNGTGSIMS